MILKNFFKPTFRHLLKDRGYLLVNILSLASGLICCIFIFKYVQNELSYDQFHESPDRIFRIENEVITQDGVSRRYANLEGKVLSRLMSGLQGVPGIEIKTRFALYANMNIEVDGEVFAENDIIAVDSSFFNFFSFKFVEGDSQSALTGPGKIVITQSTAKKYFGSNEPLGKTLIFRFEDRGILLTVTGIVEDVPSNSHFSFNMVTSASSFEQLYDISIDEAYLAYSYIKIIENISSTELEEKLNEFYIQNSPRDDVFENILHLQPVTAIHLYSSALGELSTNSKSTYIYLFTIIAFIILGIACVNFTTLATARSVKRAREMAMHKVFGAEKSSLMAIFLAEGVLLSLSALFIAYFFAWYLLPHFNLLAGKNISYTNLIDPSFFLLMVGITVLTGIIASVYPALALSKHKPIALLQNDVIKGTRSNLLWNSMVVIQLTITMILISATYIIQKQIRFIHTKDLGFNREQIIRFPNHFGSDLRTFTNQLNQHPNIEQMTVSTYIPGVNNSTGTASVEVEGKSGVMTFDWTVVDHHFFDVYDITIVEGRNFSNQLSSDSTEAFLINETAVRTLGWAEPLGKRINAMGRKGYVIGVVEDFNFRSLHSEIAPMIFGIHDQANFNISAKIRSTEQISEMISFVEDIWHGLQPDIAFSYDFVDDQFEVLYESEQRARSLFFSFSILAIIIASLGLFSFASYTIQQKTREIGIRKVLGASLFDILRQFYTGYAKLFLTATLIALPVAYIWMINWLQGFSYRTEIGVNTFAIPALLAMVVLVVAVSYRIVKGALRNPVETIRVE